LNLKINLLKIISSLFYIHYKMYKMSKMYPDGTILELGPPHYDPNAPNIKHTMIGPEDLRLNCWGTRQIISIGHASPAAEAAALAGAAEAARENGGWIGENHEGTIFNLESRQANEMQRRVHEQHGYTEFRGCKEGEFDLCAFENPLTGDVRAFKRPFIPIGGEDPFLVSMELTTASHAPEIVRGRILHPGVLEQPPLMSRAMLDAMHADPERTRRSGLAGHLSGQFVVPPPSRIYADKKKQADQQKSILKESRKGGKTRTGRARLRSRSRLRSRLRSRSRRR
jgi:hypothetical protein